MTNGHGNETTLLSFAFCLHQDYLDFVQLGGQLEFAALFPQACAQSIGVVVGLLRDVVVVCRPQTCGSDRKSQFNSTESTYCM
jgi:hypothetical protein